MLPAIIILLIIICCQRLLLHSFEELLMGQEVVPSLRSFMWLRKLRPGEEVVQSPAVAGGRVGTGIAPF